MSTLKAFSTLILLMFFLFLLSNSSKAAASEIVLYYSESCGHCQNVKAEVARKEYHSRIDFVEKELDSNKENLNSFYTALAGCNINEANAGVPMLVVSGKCYTGEDEVLDKFAALGSTLPVVLAGVPHEEAKRNTLIFITTMTVFTLGLVLVGYWKQSVEKSKTVVKLVAVIFASVLISGLQLVNLQAFCPVCTIAVGAGLGFSKYLGIDDAISGLWIGGVTFSMSLWLINWLTSKKIKFFGRKPLVLALMYATVIIPLQWGNMIGIAGNVIYGFDKVVFGIVIGSILFLLGMILNLVLVNKNMGRVYFPFQKVALPLILLIIASLFLFFIVY